MATERQQGARSGCPAGSGDHHSSYHRRWERRRVFVVDTSDSGCNIFPVDTTNREPYADVTLESVGVLDQRIGAAGQGAEIVQSMYEKALVGLSAVQLGVVERAMRIAAEYTSERQQFGRPSRNVSGRSATDGRFVH